MKRIRLGAHTMIALLLFVLAACTAGTTDASDVDEPSDATAAPGGEGSDAVAKPEIVMALADAVNLIEPHTFRSQAAYATTNALYESLVDQAFEEQEDGSFLGSRTEHVPAAAESYEIEETDDGGLVATFTLRENLKFSDGSPVTAQDFKYVFDRAAEGPGYVGAMLPFVGIESTDQITVVDERTLEIRSDVQSPLFEAFLSFQVFGAINAEVAEANATEEDPWAFQYLNSNAAGAGPYMLEEYDPDRQVVLVPNPHYWNKDEVANSRVTIRMVPDANQRALLVQSGEIDIAGGIPPQMLADLENDPNLTIFSQPTSGVQYLGMNRDIAPLDNVDVRKAILHAVPYQALLDQVMYGYATPANGVVTSTMDTHDPEIGAQYKTDLELAQQYLEDSGESGVALRLGVRESRSTDQEAAVLIQDALRQIGIELEIAVLPDADFGQQINEGTLPLFIHDWLSWGEDAFYQMTFLTTCDKVTNYARFCNEEYDALVEEGTFETDPARREEISSQAQQIFFDEAPWAPLWSSDRTLVSRSCVTGMDRDYSLVPGMTRITKSEEC